MLLRKRLCSYFLPQLSFPKIFFTHSTKKAMSSEYEALAISSLEGLSELMSENTRLNLKMERIKKFLKKKNFSFINIRGKLLFEESYEILKSFFTRALIEQDEDMIRIFVKLENDYGILKNDFDILMIQFLSQTISKDLSDFIMINFAYMAKYRLFIKEAKSIAFYYASSFDILFRYNIDKELLNSLIDDQKNKHMGLIIYSNICKNIIFNNRRWFFL